jgi:hypothetical protein
VRLSLLVWLGVHVVASSGCGRVHFADISGVSTGDGGGDDGDDAPAADARVFGNFAVPTIESALSQVGNSDVGPALGANELQLYFTSSRVGGFTLWEANRTAPGQPWSNLTLLSNIDVNGPIEYDAEPSINGLELIYGTNGAPAGLRVATRSNTAAVWPAGVVSGALPSGDRVGSSMFAGDLSMLCPGVGGAFEEYGRANLSSPWMLVQTHAALQGYGYPGVSQDGLEVFVTNASQQLFRATRSTVGDPFGAPNRYLFGNATIDNAPIADPELSLDGTVMFLAIDLAGNDYDIYTTSR